MAPCGSPNSPRHSDWTRNFACQDHPKTGPAKQFPVTRLLDDPAARASLAGKIVLIGGSAPELGGLRVTAASPATPSVWLQAEAIATILRGNVAVRPYWAGTVELIASLLLGAIGLLLAARMRPSLAKLF